jgi:TorA maturation chaperone TorD
MVKGMDRGAAYGLLSFLFLYPQEGTLDFLSSGGLEALEELADELGMDVTEPLRDFGRRLEAGEAERAGLLLDLQRDYTRLFINAFPKMVAPPYSSVYMDGKGKVWGESTSWVYNLYREAGLEISEDFHNLPDHIAAELGFAAFLLSGAEKGREANMVMYERLVTEHLAIWAEPFLRRVMEGAREPFYTFLAEATARLVEAENRRLRGA